MFSHFDHQNVLNVVTDIECDNYILIIPKDWQKPANIEYEDYCLCPVWKPVSVCVPSDEKTTVIIYFRNESVIWGLVYKSLNKYIVLTESYTWTDPIGAQAGLHMYCSHISWSGSSHVMAHTFVCISSNTTIYRKLKSQADNPSRTWHTPDPASILI